MINDNLKEDILHIIFEYANPDQTVVFLFGSFAQAKQGKSSDIDIGICGNEIIPLERMAALREELTEKASTLRRIDPVDFRQVTDPVFLKNALGEAILWYQGKDCKITFNDWKRRILN
jgi:predicted nucleotidyltransferase